MIARPEPGRASWTCEFDPRNGALEEMAGEITGRAESSGVSPLEDGLNRSGDIEEELADDGAKESIGADGAEESPSRITLAQTGELEDQECPVNSNESGHPESPVSAATEAAAGGATTDRTDPQLAVNLGASLAGEPKSPMSAEMGSVHDQAPTRSPCKGREGGPLAGSGGGLDAMVVGKDEEVSGGLEPGNHTMASDEIARVAVAVEREATGEVLPGVCKWP